LLLGYWLLGYWLLGYWLLGYYQLKLRYSIFQFLCTTYSKLTVTSTINPKT
jgi:hypothetical protein